MSDQSPRIWLDAPLEIRVDLTQWLSLLGVQAEVVPDPIPAVDERGIGGICFADACASRLDHAQTLPWVALDADPARWLGAVQTPFATLAWPCTLSGLQGIVQRLISRWRGEQLVVAGRGLVGHTPVMRQLRAEIEQVAPSDATVLILGESGTGKEVVARMIHRLSNRADKPFVPVNCGAIPAELLESELFGHEKGAFTGAISARPGRFELAEGGTLFLDEIGDMPLPMQVKILRVLQERTFERVGGRHTFTADVRIVAATHRDLEVHIQEGSFRQDLYYRLNVFPLETHPLRALAEDIPEIVRALTQRFALAGRPVAQLTDGALAVLAALPWPGNVRELGNVIERLGILYPDQIVDVAQLPEKLRMQLPADWQMPDMPAQPAAVAPAEQMTRDDAAPEDVDPRDMYAAGRISTDQPAGLRLPIDEQELAQCQCALPEADFDLKNQLEAIERAWIEQALTNNGGVVAQAARQLGIRRTTLVEKLRKYQMSA
jgi:sigma-54 dependent transcriptional regulator, flagellar regulatory protein